MGLINWMFGKRALPASPAPRKRGYQGAQVGRLTASWAASNLSADEEIKRSLRLLRARCRERRRNDDYAKRFIGLVKRNVIGSTGIQLQNKARDMDGTLDKRANDIIEDRFKRWGKKGSCDVTGRLSWIDACNLYVETLAIDGEVLVRLVGNWNRNPDRFAIQFLDSDLLDEDYNAELSNGHRIRMGVEIDDWGRAAAYHLLSAHPSESYVRGTRRYIRVPASEIIHDFLPERVNQNRGVPWMASPLLRMHMLGGYEDAEITAARIGASKMGFFTRADDGEGYEGEEDSDGAITMDAQPGSFEQLPAGVKLESWDPDHPNANFGTFVKSTLRGIASGLDVSYNALANDLEGVNYSSIRAGVQEDREAWKALQAHIIESFCAPVFTAWLNSGLMGGSIGLPPNKIEKFDAAEWQGRRWDWVDPKKEQDAHSDAVNNRFKSRSQIIRESGRDPDEVWEEIAQEEAKLRSLGILPIPTTSKDAVNGNPQEND
jgi:lambda family phage portal protein